MMVKKLIRNFAGIIAALYLFFVVMLPLPLLAVAFIIVNPIDDVLYLKIACFVQGSFIHNITFCLEKLCGIKVRMTGVLAPREPALVLSNHLTHDWVHIYASAIRNGTLGCVRTVIKDAIKLVPGFGQAMILTKWPFVSRDFRKDEKTLHKLFSLYTRAKLPVQLWIFPEGTRMTPKKLASSQKYAQEKGYPVWKHVMLPRHRGFITALNSLNGIVKYIHETTIQYEGWTDAKGVDKIPGIGDLINTNGNYKHVLHFHLNRVPVTDIPADDEGRQKYLQECFGRKEALLEYYAKNKQFPGENLANKIPTASLLAHVVGWFVGSIALMFFYINLFNAIF